MTLKLLIFTGGFLFRFTQVPLHKNRVFRGYGVYRASGIFATQKHTLRVPSTPCRVSGRSARFRAHVQYEFAMQTRRGGKAIPDPLPRSNQ